MRRQYNHILLSSGSNSGHLANHPHWRKKYRNPKQIFPEKGNCAATVPISASVCLWVIYKFPRSICLFCCRKICGPILEIFKSLSDTHECGNWDWGYAIPRKGIHKWDFRCSAHGARTLIKKISLLYKEIQKRSVAKSYMTNGLLIYD